MAKGFGSNQASYPCLIIRWFIFVNYKAKRGLNYFESEKGMIINLRRFLFGFVQLAKHGGLYHETPFDLSAEADKLPKVTELVS